MLGYVIRSRYINSSAVECYEQALEKRKRIKTLPLFLKPVGIVYFFSARKLVKKANQYEQERLVHEEKYLEDQAWYQYRRGIKEGNKKRKRRLEEMTIDFELIKVQYQLAHQELPARYKEREEYLRNSRENLSKKQQ